MPTCCATASTWKVESKTTLLYQFEQTISLHLKWKSNPTLKSTILWGCAFTSSVSKGWSLLQTSVFVTSVTSMASARNFSTTDNIISVLSWMYKKQHRVWCQQIKHFFPHQVKPFWKCLRDGCWYQNGWIFGKVPYRLWPPPLIFGKSFATFFFKFHAQKARFLD